MLYIGKVGTWYYHRKDSPQLSNTPANLQIGFARIPKNPKFSPCPLCIGTVPPQHIPKQIDQPTAMEKQLRKFLSGHQTLSKGEVIGDAICAFCDQLGMHAEIKGGTAFITTISGEWYFRYNDRPITVCHKNSDKRLRFDGTPYQNLYHVQSGEFYSPAHVISYIAAHDKPIHVLEHMIADIKGENAQTESAHSSINEKDNKDDRG